MIKNEIVKKYVTLTLFLVVILGTLIGASLLLAPVKEKSILKSKLKKYSKIADNVTEVKEVEFTKGVISEKLLGLNKSGKEVATLYTAAKSNQYGNIEIIVAVDATGKILGIDATIMDQSISPDKTSAYLRSFKGSNIQSPVSNGDVAKPTVGVSVGTVIEILNEVAGSHGIKISALEETFGKGATTTNKVVIDEGFTKSYEEVKLNNELVGYAYTARGTFGYDYEPSLTNPQYNEAIELELYLDLDLIVKGYDFTKYDHTKSYIGDSEAYLALLIDGNKNISEAKDLFVKGDYTSGSYSVKGVYELVLSISDYVAKGLELVFGDVTEINEGTIVSSQDVLLGNEVKKTIYVVEDVIFFKAAAVDKNEIVKISFTINKETNVIESYEFIQYDHSEGKWQQHVITYLDNLISENTTLDQAAEKVIEDDSVGATYTARGIVKMLLDLSKYLKEGE